MTTRTIWGRAPGGIAGAMMSLAIAATAYAQTQPAATSDTAPAAATREESLRLQREAKAAQVTPPPKPGWKARIWDMVESTYGPEASQWNGISPRVGSVVAGGGFALGARYRNTLLFDRRARLDAIAVGSIKQYYRVDGRFGARQLGGTPLFAEAAVGVREYTQEDFFGLGPDSARSSRTNFLYRDFRATASGGVDLLRGVSVGTELTFLNPGVGRGQDSLYPSIEEGFTDAEAPGLSSQPDFLMTSVVLAVDRIGSPENSRTGGSLRLAFTNAADRDTGAYSYRQIDLDAMHFFPFFEGKRVIVVRGVFSTTDTDEGEQVPFYLQPFIGGRRTLRGFEDQRFRGPHLMLLQAEYRFEVAPALDIALFYDTGKVAERRSDLDFSDMKRDFGISLRFGGQNAFFRVDIARGGESRRFSAAFGDVF